MKKLKITVSLLLCCCLFCGSIGTAAAAVLPGSEQEDASVLDAYNPFANLKTDETQNTTQRFVSLLRQVFAKCLNVLSNFVINGVVGKTLALTVPGASSVQRYETFDLDAYGNFYTGHETFLASPAENAGWRLGYASKSIMPADFGEKSYAKGAYLPYIFGNEMYRDDDGEYEELRVRTIAVDDGSGRGTAVFCSVDAIGLANADVRKIREALADFAAENDIVSLNVSCTHIHTGIDSQGVWTDPLKTAVHNMFDRKNVAYGVDRTFLQAIIDGAKNSVIEAYDNMTSGRLYYSAMDIGNYVWDRTAPISLDATLYKLEFVPDDEALAPTLIATFGCHPESSSFDWDSSVDENGKKDYDRKFSADFIWYMEKVINAAGFNFIFIQGNVGTVTSSRGLSNDGDLDGNAHGSAVRYGYEMGYIALTMNMTEEERIAVNEETGDRLGVDTYAGQEGYSVWYQNLPTVQATEVSPLLNIAHRQFICPVDNNLISVIGKTGVADNLILKSWYGQYYTVTEVGYMQLGENTLQVYLSPGETFTELLKGGSGLVGFPYKAIREVLGENVIIFDLMNDAAGYVANDANFVMAGMQYNENSGELDSDAWCLVSFGRHAGSTFIGNFYELVNDTRK
ncbi:MAG: hypothetical protein IJT27_07930 [Clostridia bacterium]|nr:hypothetical protein [Clostridia bacterium]